MKDFDSIIGYSKEKRDLEQVADILKNKAIYEKLGVRSPRGLLLYGGPGVGKTLMAEALIEASGRPAYVCRKDVSDGSFISVIKRTFYDAAANDPSIVFLDDMDKFANGDRRHKNEEEYVTIQSCMDQVRDREVFVIATANSTEELPDSLLRNGRFDRIMEIEIPRGEDAVMITDHFLRSKGSVKGVDARTVARLMDGRSCADLETVINEAGIEAGFSRSEEIEMEHVMKALLRNDYGVNPAVFEGAQQAPADLSDRESRRARVIYHEAGHAAISEVLFPESVTIVSAYSRDGSEGGFTGVYRELSVDPMKWQKGDLAVTLGGMAALEHRFGINDKGAECDLEQAFRSARNLVEKDCVCGFRDFSYGYLDSEELKRRQEEAAAAEVDRFYRKAKEILAANDGFFEKIASELAKKGLLTAKDVQEIKKECRIQPVPI